MVLETELVFHKYSNKKDRGAFMSYFYITNFDIMLLEIPNGVYQIQIIYIWFCNAWYDVSVADLPNYILLFY